MNQVDCLLRTKSMSSVGRVFGLVAVAVVASCAGRADAVQENKQLQQALAIKPVHALPEEYDIPTAEQVAGCTVESSKKEFNVPGWVVRDPSGRILRAFLDATGGDNELDQWSFYKNGIEVYRDIDTNRNRKKDQHRWMGTAGIRWGIDEDEDGTIDSWKMISGDEVATEVFLAVRDGDARRFAALLPTKKELDSINLGSQMAKTVTESVERARRDFAAFAKAQKAIRPDARFVHFGSSRPCLVPSGMSGVGEDLVIYDHGSAVYESNKELSQLALGTLLRIGDGWRVLELPAVIDEKSLVANGGLFFNAGGGESTALASAAPDAGPLADLFEKWDRLDNQLRDAKAGPETEKLQRERATVLLELAIASKSADDRRNWARQMTDTVTNAFQTGLFEDGLKVLDELAARMKKEGLESELDYVAWRTLSARYTKAFQSSGADRAAATERFMKDLESFATAFPKSEFAAEALMQLALYTEVNESEDSRKAVGLYERLAKEFPDSPYAAKAAGARLRLTANGQKLAVRGKTIAGQPFDSQEARWRGKSLVLYYWATWSPGVGDDFKELQRLAAKYKDELQVVGINIDEKREEMAAFLKQQPNASWPNLFEEGGLEGSPLAIQLGITAPPLVVLLDGEGKVVDTSLTVSELDREIQRQSRREN